MRCPSLRDLPQPPRDRHGWPWTEESPRLNDNMPDGSPWPRISVVTPSFNQGRFLEETIRSVLLQGYPNLEYRIFDGGSGDNSVGVIEKYAPWLVGWASEADRGQAHAINKGFSHSTGDLLAWINSDDLYEIGALKLFGKSHLSHPKAILMGDVTNFMDGGDRTWLTRQFNVSFQNIIAPSNDFWSWHQPGVFVPKNLFAAVGPLDEGLRYVFDLDWLLRLLQRAEVHYLRTPVARFRVHQAAKTTAEYPNWVQEGHRLLQIRYWPATLGLDISQGKALHHLRMAQIYLGYQPNHSPHWHRLKGLHQLLHAFHKHPNIIFHLDFLKLFRRAMLPKRFLRSSPWAVTNER